MHDDKRTKIFEHDAESPTLFFLKYEKMIKEIQKDNLLSTCFPNMIKKVCVMCSVHELRDRVPILMSLTLPRNQGNTILEEHIISMDKRIIIYVL